ncbi:MAG TPA: exodeoxyribonuclease V subunit beta [Deltaproteobacteria bacterium]|nr:exodeoxyribonuclease V subunit beta [Deltaproteobacteria bacterium]
MKELDLTGIPLEGAHLIEASAGTGKTYAIGSLYLRLLLEKGFTVDQILVVTYTVAATEELTGRIRGNIRKALSAFQTGQSDDAFISELLNKYPDHDRARLILDHALKLFDEAAIFTIHGFCQRVLSEMAFESRSLFDAELITDQQDILLEVVDDFYRKQFTADQPPTFIHYARNIKKIAPESLMKLIVRVSLDAEIIPRIKRPDITPHLDVYRHAFEQVKNTWQAMHGEITEILLTHPGFNRNKYRKTSIPKWIDAMNEFTTSHGDDLLLFNVFGKFTTSSIADAMKDGHNPPGHPFFVQCEELRTRADELVASMDEYLIWIKGELFDYVRDHLAEKKDRMGVIFFNDLLLKVRSALASETGPSLVSALRNTYRAALIDEFQDTDPIQYGIFRTVFDGLPMFLIGDPKQAIYSFRGADIFTYLNAAQHIARENRHTLKKNWRSEEELIHALNRFFSRPGNENPFVFNQIEFVPVDAADKEGRVVLRDSEGAPLTLWFISPDNGTSLNKESSEQEIVRATAVEISRLLDRESDEVVRIGDRLLRPDDIAVLVRENRQAALIRDELVKYSIPCVLFSDENVFDSPETIEMEVLLKAVSQPHSEGLVKSALATSIMGMGSQEIDALINDEASWEDCLISFRHYHELWASKGFMRMFRELLSAMQVRRKVLALKRGERMLTNFLHLAELMNQASAQRRLGMSDLMKWLALQRETSQGRADEYQLRLESDENAVKIQTVHKSKGLEYAVVFCPFTWGASTLRDKDHFAFHDPDKDWKAVFELGSERIEENARQAEKEALAENMRLLYVALTRAVNRCYVVWGAISNTSTSAPAYLLHNNGLPPDSDGIEPLKQLVLDTDTMRQELSDLVTPQPSSIIIRDIPVGVPKPYTPPGTGDALLAHREFAGTIDRSWRVSSFSALTSEAAHAGEMPDYDALYLRPSQAGVAGDGGRRDIFSFPRGARPGTMMHELFENLDFLSENATISTHVSDTLSAYGYDTSWQDVIAGMIRNVLSVTIDDFCLSQVRKDQRLNELEFYFPLSRVSRRDLASCFASAGVGEIPGDFPSMIEELHFDQVHGFMRGFIDMVFYLNGRYYLVDWKSNYLGSHAADYNRATLEAAMKDNFYILQYHLYTLAVHHFLKKRVQGYSYDEHFGGVIYVFLRGVDPGLGEEYGIYHARPSAELIEKLSRVLISGME